MYGDETTRKIQNILNKYKKYKLATKVAVLTSWTTRQGVREANLWADTVPHTKQDCRLYLALDKETWPRLF
jgi:hypothetical protein